MKKLQRYWGYVVAVDPMPHAPDGSGKRVKVRVKDPNSVYNGRNFIVDGLPTSFTPQTGMDVTFALASFGNQLKAIDLELANVGE